MTLQQLCLHTYNLSLKVWFDSTTKPIQEAELPSKKDLPAPAFPLQAVLHCLFPPASPGTSLPSQ